MKLYELLQLRTVISSHIGQNENLPAGLAYKIMKLIKNTQNDVDFYQEKYSDIIQQYAERDDKGQLIQTEDHQGIKIQENKKDECVQKLSELNNTEVDKINIKFSLAELEPYEFSITDMLILDEVIKEEE